MRQRTQSKHIRASIACVFLTLSVLRIICRQNLEVLQLLESCSEHGLIVADQFDHQFAPLSARAAIRTRQQLTHPQHGAEHTGTLQTTHAIATTLEQIAGAVAIVAVVVIIAVEHLAHLGSARGGGATHGIVVADAGEGGGTVREHVVLVSGSSSSSRGSGGSGGRGGSGSSRGRGSWSSRRRNCGGGSRSCSSSSWGPVRSRNSSRSCSRRRDTRSRGSSSGGGRNRRSRWCHSRSGFSSSRSSSGRRCGLLIFVFVENGFPSDPALLRQLLLALLLLLRKLGQLALHARLILGFGLALALSVCGGLCGSGGLCCESGCARGGLRRRGIAAAATGTRLRGGGRARRTIGASVASSSASSSLLLPSIVAVAVAGGSLLLCVWRIARALGSNARLLCFAHVARRR